MEKGIIYRYQGGVMQFNQLVASNWRGQTRAISPKKAAANLVYQYKQQAGLMPNTRITLTGEPVAAN